MGSISSPTPTGMRLPTIKLDTTLAQLYKRASSQNATARIGLVLCGASSGLDLSPGFPRNKKFLYQDTPFNTVPPEELTPTNTSLRKSLAMKYLSLIPQRDAFIAGKTPVIFFNTDKTADQVEHDREETVATVSVLDPSQQPNLVFCPGPAGIPMEEHGIDKITYKLALDDLEKYPLTHDMDTHWFLNSKAGLADSGLPTPRSRIIPTEGSFPSKEECCQACSASKGDLPFIPPDCTGPRGSWLESQTNRVVAAIKERPIPFVFKTQQTFGGAGTWVVTTPEQKESLLSDLTSQQGPLRKLLSQLNSSNAHLHPGSVIISDMVRDPIGDYGITFIVTDKGEALFLAASEQMIDDNNAWVGSTINYANQERLRGKFGDLMSRTAKWVADRGYFGPVGIDVLETKTEGETESQTGEQTKYHVVDLNVRTSGSLALPFLKGHFTGRGLTCASSFSVTVKGGRAEFMGRWRSEFEEGRMLILSWYEDKEAKESIADVVVGGEDEKALQGLMKKVRETTEEVTF